MVPVVRIDMIGVQQGAVVEMHPVPMAFRGFHLMDIVYIPVGIAAV